MNRNVDFEYWYKIMKYIREVSGTVYEEELLELLQSYPGGIPSCPKDAGKVVDFLNQVNPFGVIGCFLKTDDLSGGIYTIPSQRQQLDGALFEHYENTAQPYSYNRFLYMEALQLPKSTWTFERILERDKDRPETEKVFSLDEERQLKIDLTLLEGKEVAVSDFDLQAIANHFQVMSFGKINAANVLFVGDTNLQFNMEFRSSPFLKNGMCFCGATFCKDLRIKNITFEMSAEEKTEEEYDSTKVDFRNVRFFGSVSFRDIRFIGDTSDTELSFEDARIAHGTEAGGQLNKIEFRNIDFAHTQLNLFQMVVGRFVFGIAKADKAEGRPDQNRILFAHVVFAEDAVLNLSDVEINNGLIEMKNVPTLPASHFSFSPIAVLSDAKKEAQDRFDYWCPDNYLLFKNCEIRQSLHICNVRELSFQSTQNYGKILEDGIWGKFDEKKHHKSVGLFGTKIGGTIINSHLLWAIYKCRCREAGKTAEFRLCCDKARNFIMMKENFAEAGRYDDEDDAFVLYMEFKPYLNGELKNKRTVDHKTKVLYKLLYDAGRYGISPGRVIVALGIMVGMFTVFYWIFALFLGGESFSLNATMGGIWCYLGKQITPSATLSEKFGAAFLYSLEGIIPFVSQFEPINFWVCILTAVENAIGSFLVGYFSVAVVRKTLR